MRRAVDRPRCAVSLWFSHGVGLVLALLVAGLGDVYAQQSEGGTSVAQRPLRLGVLISSDSDRCYDAGVFKAIRNFAREEINEINRTGGIGGRRVELRLFDDGEDVEKTVAFVKQAVDDPDMIGLVGISSSTRGNIVFGRIGAEVGASALPLVTDISLSQIYAPYKNVFSMASAVADELEVVRTLLKDRGFKRPAFIGIKGDLYSASLGDGLAAAGSEPPLALDRRVTVKDYRIDQGDVAPVVRDIQAAEADLVILAIHSAPGATVLGQLLKAGYKVPVLVLYGRIATILRLSDKLPDDLKFFQLARDGVPYVYNERLRQLIWQSQSARWIFEDTPNAANRAGWESGLCKPKKDTAKRQIFDGGNRRAIGRGMQYRDVLHLMATLAREVPAGADVAAIRRHVSRELGGFVEGKKVFKGLWQDWTFTSNRAAASDILITTSGSDPKSAALAPIQYRRVNATLVRSPVVDMSIDLIRIAGIDSNERRFDAEFYLSLKSVDNKVSIAAVDFTNAARSHFSRDRLISSRAIHEGEGGSKFPVGVKVYKVAGTFQFNPDLGAYPFDTQRLSVSFQARSAANPFLIQPPAQVLRQANGEVDGWVLRDQYVGSEQDIISTIAEDGVGRHVVPIYKFNQTWVVRRISVDYYIRVVVPLAFILLVTYFSVYLPASRFDSTVAIQVTALLSSIALYLALPKVESDQATLSDKMFIMTYAAVALMIGLTILKDARWLAGFGAVRLVVVGFQRVAFPAATAAIVLYLMSTADRQGGDLAQSLRDLWQSFAG